MIFQFFLLINLAAIVNAAKCVSVPDSCPKERIDFRLFTQLTDPYGNSYQELKLNDDNSIKRAIFDQQAQIKFILHGYSGKAENPLMKALILEYLQSTSPVNVIMVNYDKVAQVGCYLKLFWNASNLGKCCARLIEKILQLRSDIKLKQFHVIGFSIGAHIGAQIANHLGNEQRLERITGLDPAFMFFFPIIVSSKNKLNKEHAKFVDIIHTNIFWYGIPYSGGHYDFYANGGKVQPGCEDEEDKSTCYHSKAVKYYIKTINNEGIYKARKILCNINLWLANFCWESTKTNPEKKEVGEHATVPSEEEEGSYQFIT